MKNAHPNYSKSQIRDLVKETGKVIKQNLGAEINAVKVTIQGRATITTEAIIQEGVNYIDEKIK